MKAFYEITKFFLLFFVAFTVSDIVAHQENLKSELTAIKQELCKCGPVAEVRPTPPGKPNSFESQETGAPHFDASETASPKNSDVMTFEQLQKAAQQLDQSGKARDYADLLVQIENTAFYQGDRHEVDKLQASLVVRLRELVESEAHTLHKLALNAPNYGEGYSYFRDASAIIALYPMADEKDVMLQAEELSEKHRKVEAGLLTHRRQRYNFWAASQIQNALKVLRNGAKGGAKTTIEYLTVIEPSQLEPSVSAIYSYTVQQLMDELKMDEKAEVAKKLSNPDNLRRTLEDF